MMVHVRTCIAPALIKVRDDMTKANGIVIIQELLATSQQADGIDPEEPKQLAAIEEGLGVKPASSKPGSNRGTLIPDATCVPDNIPCPVDLRLLNKTREATEKAIEKLFSCGKIDREPRYNRNKSDNFSWQSSRRKSQGTRRYGKFKYFQINEISHDSTRANSIVRCGTVFLRLKLQLHRKPLVSGAIQCQQQEYIMQTAGGLATNSSICRGPMCNCATQRERQGGKANRVRCPGRQASVCGRSRSRIAMVLQM